MTNHTSNLAPRGTETEVLPQGDRQSLNQELPAPARPPSSSVGRLKRCFSFPVFLGAILVGANFTIVRGLRLDPDTWWHLKYGETILQTGRWPTVDTWSFTAHGLPGVAYEWGGEVLTALAYRRGGLLGLDFLLITLTSIIVVLIYYFAWLRSRNSYAAFFATFLILPLAALVFTLRPQLFGYIFLLGTLILLERFRQGEQMNLWALPVLFFVWVNTHGSFAFGFMILGLYWLCGLADFSSGGLYTVRWREAQRLHMELVGLMSVAVLPLTPYGTRLAAVPLEYLNSLPLNLSSIVEWQPINTDLWQAKMLLVFFLGFIVAQAAFRFRYRLEDVALFLLVTYMSFVHFRFVILFAIVFAPLAASLFVRWAPTYTPKIDKYSINAVLMLAALAAIVWYFPSQATLQTDISNNYPVQAAHYLEKHPVPGRMFNDYSYGGYLDWAMVPGNKVFIDGRGNIFEPAGLFSAYADVVGLKSDAFATLESYRINYCVIPLNGALATLLSDSSDWKEIYQDTLCAIFVRRTLKLSSSLSLSGNVGRLGRQPAKP